METAVRDCRREKKIKFDLYILDGNANEKGNNKQTT
jgi:hypothetical protein